MSVTIHVHVDIQNTEENHLDALVYSTKISQMTQFLVTVEWVSETGM